MKETVLITGASGLIGQGLILVLKDQYHLKFLTRTPVAQDEFGWDPAKGKLDEAALEGVDYIVHLAGSKLNDGTPLTAERQQLVRDTRIGASMLLLKALKDRNQKLKAFVSASAMGYYGFTDDTLEIDENGNMGTDFGARLCEDWERAADEFKLEGVAERVVKLRVSLVLGREGSLFKSFKDSLASQPDAFAQAKGNSYFPWVHVNDIAGMFAFGVQNQAINGVFNTTAPETTSREVIFNQMYNLYAGKTAAFEQTQTTLPLQHLSSKKIVLNGFKFQYPTINAALKNLTE